MRTRHFFILLLGAASLAACQDVVGTSGDLTPDEVAGLADGLITTSFDATGQVAEADASNTADGLLLAYDPITSHTEFTITRSCLIDGQVVLEGTRDREWDRTTHTGSSDLSLTKTHQDCTRPLVDSDVAVTLNGAPSVAVEAHHAWADGRRSGLQSLSMEGAIDWVTSDDRSGTCVIDLDVTFDPETHTRTVVGQACHRTIDATTTWQTPNG